MKNRRFAIFAAIGLIVMALMLSSTTAGCDPYGGLPCPQVY